MNGYNSLAYFYDLFTDDIDYQKTADKLHDLFLKEKHKPEIILDLGCGTGSLSFLLQQKGYDMIAVDISEDMLLIAREKAESLNIENILFLQQDAAKLDLYGTIDACVCNLDVINHITSREKLLEVFNKVHLFLRPSGLFVFDINTVLKFSTVFLNNSYITEKEGTFCAFNTQYSKKSGVCRIDYTFFKEDEKGLYERYEDTQRERAYEIDEIKDMLKLSGFMNVKVKYSEGNNRALIECKS